MKTTITYLPGAKAVKVSAADRVELNRVAGEMAAACRGVSGGVASTAWGSGKLKGLTVMAVCGEDGKPEAFVLDDDDLEAFTAGRAQVGEIAKELSDSARPAGLLAWLTLMGLSGRDEEALGQVVEK
jgi:hypothetical protein